MDPLAGQVLSELANDQLKEWLRKEQKALTDYLIFPCATAETKRAKRAVMATKRIELIKEELRKRSGRL